MGLVLLGRKTDGKTRPCNRCGKEYDPKIIRGKSGLCGSCRTTVYRQKLKAKSVAYKGGKCILCGYNKCIASLVFHHVDPSTKSFAVSEYSVLSEKKVFEELDKCVLLCSNCHGEVENGLAEIPEGWEKYNWRVM